MTTWLVLAPEREGDEALANSAWIAHHTISRTSPSPLSLLGVVAVRRRFEELVARTTDLSGVAFFGHGAQDRLFDAERTPNDPNGPTVLDFKNISLLKDRWVHAFACWSGQSLAHHAVSCGVSIYVGYAQPLDVGWSVPPPAESEFIAMVTCMTMALLEGIRDERTLRARMSQAADDFFVALESTPGADQRPGWMWLHKLSQDLVDHLVVVQAGQRPEEDKPT